MEQKADWPKIFTNLINDQTKLVGTTISTFGPVHVQSFCFAVDYIALKLLIKKKIFQHAITNKQHVVYHCELGMTRTILDAGYKIDSLLLQYQSLEWINYIQKEALQKDFNKGESPTYPLRYGSTGYNLDPYEAVFYKNMGTYRQITDRNEIILCPNETCNYDDLIKDKINEHGYFQFY